MGQFSGKTVVITGGTSGIGLATAKRFVEEGAHVFITGRRDSALGDATRSLGKENVTAVLGDVSNLADLDRLYGAVSERGRGIDVLFANAGIIEAAALEDITPEHLEKLLATNFHGVVFTVQRALPLINEGGSVVLNSSVNASRGRAGIGVYSAIKAGIRSFARTWANELRTRGIRVNTVSPATIDTPGVEALGTDAEHAKALKAAAADASPLGRIGRPDEVANAVVFLASDQASFTTGSELFVDGGGNQI